MLNACVNGYEKKDISVPSLIKPPCYRDGTPIREPLDGLDYFLGCYTNDELMDAIMTYNNPSSWPIGLFLDRELRRCLKRLNHNRYWPEDLVHIGTQLLIILARNHLNASNESDIASLIEISKSVTPIPDRCFYGDLPLKEIIEERSIIEDLLRENIEKLDGQNRILSKSDSLPNFRTISPFQVAKKYYQEFVVQTDNLRKGKEDPQNHSIGFFLYSTCIKQLRNAVSHVSVSFSDLDYERKTSLAARWTLRGCLIALRRHINLHDNGNNSC